MDTRQVILAAAQFIEEHPQQYRFLCLDQPQSTISGAPCSVACALGWIAYFGGFPRDESMLENAAVRIGMRSQDAFYRALDRLQPDPRLSYTLLTGRVIPQWDIDDPLQTAQGLRKLADELYPMASN